MFGVNMLARTEGGNTWTEAEYREWLHDAGFCDIEVTDLSERERTAKTLEEIESGISWAR